MAQPGFQTTFIPKRDDANRRRATSGGGVFMIVGVVIFVGTLAAAIAFFSYIQILNSNIENKDEELKTSQDEFEPGLVELLAGLDLQLENAEEILGNHVAPSKIFTMLERATVESVQFTRYSMVYDPQTDIVTITLDGEGQSYASVALQSDEFEEHEAFSMTVFSGVNLDEQRGTVRFSVNTQLAGSYVDYVSELTPGASTSEPVEPIESADTTDDVQASEPALTPAVAPETDVVEDEPDTVPPPQPIVETN